MKLSLVLAGLLGAVSTGSGQGTKEAQQCYHWFSTLGYPDLREARLAEVWQGMQSSPTLAFVISSSWTQFTVVRLDLTQKNLTKSWPLLHHVLPDYRCVAFEAKPFAGMIDQRLKLLNQTPPERLDLVFSNRHGRRAGIFLLSYVCWQRGELELAARLYEAAQKVPHTHVNDRIAASMQEALEIDLGHLAMWDAVLRCGGSNLADDLWPGRTRKSLEPRASLLEAFRRVVRLFPRCAHIDRAKGAVATLERMVEEDSHHPVLTQEQLSQLPLEQRIAELVWLLRDQNGHQWSQPGGCDVFDMHETGASPAHQLLAIGDPAIPALIQALTDDRFSRSVGFHRDFRFSHVVLTVGDCALQILHRMTEQDFFRVALAGGRVPEANAERMLLVQQVAQAWWEEGQRKGKKQMLVDSIASGTIAPYRLVQQLREVAPETVADAVLRGAEKAQDEWMAARFVAVLSSLKSEEITQRLVTFAQRDYRLQVRLRAIAGLLNQGHPAALSAAFDEWVGYPAEGDNGMRTGFRDTADLLLASGDEQAVRKLVDRWDKRIVDERMEIVRALGDWVDAAGWSYSFAVVKGKGFSPAAKNVAMELLAHALEDTAQRAGQSSSDSFRVCDFALQSLHQMDPQKFDFSPSVETSLWRRDVGRATAAYIWHKEH